MVENYMKDLKESIYHGAVISVLAMGYTISQVKSSHLYSQTITS